MKLLFENWRQYLNEGITPRVLYHGSPQKFEFIKDFDLEMGVGAIYTFFDEELAVDFARYQSGGGGFVYGLELKPSANIVDLIDFENYGELEISIKEYIKEQTSLPENLWQDFIMGDLRSYQVFEHLDYNEEFISLLKNKNVDGLIFIDDLPEVGRKKAKVCALLGTESIENVTAHENEETAYVVPPLEGAK